MDKKMTKEEKQSLIAQQHKIDSIKRISEMMLSDSNWFSKAATWAIDHETLEEVEGMKLKWQEIKSHYKQLEEILK